MLGHPGLQWAQERPQARERAYPQATAESGVGTRDTWGVPAPCWECVAVLGARVDGEGAKEHAACSRDASGHQGPSPQHLASACSGGLRASLIQPHGVKGIFCIAEILYINLFCL